MANKNVLKLNTFTEVHSFFGKRPFRQIFETIEKALNHTTTFVMKQGVNIKPKDNT
jgi:hypothetical protein